MLARRTLGAHHEKEEYAGRCKAARPILQDFLEDVYVDPKYITEPLSEEDLRAANAWKVEYLRRLRAEKTDESYINAYMQAWSLSSNEVFGAESVEPENVQ